MPEEVLVVPSKSFEDFGPFQGFYFENPHSYLQHFSQECGLQYQPRPEVETNFGYKQIIPYVILVHRDDLGNLMIFHYERGSGQGEERLHSKVSIGVGGHINKEDDMSGFIAAYASGMKRELYEEVEINSPYQNELIGLINDDSNDVGRVHLGVVHALWLEKPDVKPKEEDLLNSGFLTVEQLGEKLANMESWSQHCFYKIAEWENEPK